MADQPDPLATVRAALDLAAKAASPPWWVNEHHDGWCEIDAKHLVDTATLHNAAAIVALRNAAPAIAALADECAAARDRIATLEAELAQARSMLKEAADLFIAIQATDGEAEHRAICDGAALAAKIDAIYDKATEE